MDFSTYTLIIEKNFLIYIANKMNYAERKFLSVIQVQHPLNTFMWFKNQMQYKGKRKKEIEKLS
jgi:hypothetical protein